MTYPACLSYIVNVKETDDLIIQAARTSAVLPEISCPYFVNLGVTLGCSSCVKTLV